LAIYYGTIQMKTKYVFCLFICILFFCQSLLGGELKSEEEKTFKMKSGGSITIIGDEKNYL